MLILIPHIPHTPVLITILILIPILFPITFITIRILHSLITPIRFQYPNSKPSYYCIYH